jgi:DNA primase
LLSGREKIQEVLLRTDLVELVRAKVELRKVGRSWAGLCPFHGERSPSFHVFPESRRFKCFGCDKGGDALTFVMELDGKDFRTALRELADRAGVPLVTDPEEERRIANRRALLHACQVAGAYFESSLWGQAGAEGRAHLQQRRISEAVARSAGLGYAPQGWQGLVDHLQREGVDSEKAVEAGLILRREGRGGFYDVFRERLMIPIRDADGRIIGFGGRVVGGDDPRKYINSRETPLYRKSRVLYGLDVARDALRARKEAVRVDGYFDAIALWEAGIDHTVALCSTALTHDHLGLLERLGVERIVLLLDGDAAGQLAAMRLAGPLLASGMSANVITLPGGDDPESFLHAQGAEALRTLEQQAPRLSDHVLSRVLPDGGGYEEAMAALGELRQVVAALPRGVERSLFLSQVARGLALPPRDVEAFFQGNLPVTANTQENPAPAQPLRGGPGPSGRWQHDDGSRGGPRPPERWEHGGSRGGPRPSDRWEHEGSRGARSPGAGRPAAWAPPPRRELEVTACLLAFPHLREAVGSEVLRHLGDLALREAVDLLLTEGMEEEGALARLPSPLRVALAERVRQLGSHPDKDWEQEIRDGLLHLEIEKLREDLRNAIGMRDELERGLLRPDGADEQLLEEARTYGQHAAKIRERMEALRQRLRNAS